MRKNSAFRFCNAQVGDKVYSPFIGIGEISGVSDMFIVVEVMHGKLEFYKDGKYFSNIGEPCLFYVNKDGKHVTERPIDFLSAESLYRDDLLEIQYKDGTSVKRYFAYCNICVEGNEKFISVYANGATSFTWEDIDVFDLHNLDENVDKIVLAKEVKIDNVVYPAGTRVV